MNWKVGVLAVLLFARPGLSQPKCISGDCISGFGEAVFYGGSRYIGQFLNRKPHGFGTMIFPEGHRYTGNWKNQIREGHGKFVFASGVVYEGDFVKNTFEGKGTMVYSNGNTYAGEWAENTPNGYGEMTFRSGNRYIGYFLNGWFDGMGTMWYADGSIYEGSWKSGKYHGEGMLTRSDGSLKTGTWAAGTFSDQPAPKPVLAASGYETRSSVADKPANPVEIWAVLVGVSQYTHLQPLRYTDDDAYKLALFLSSPEGGAVPRSHLEILIDDGARREKIVQALVQAANKADENDVLLFYFSGHGLDGAFLPVDFDGIHNGLPHVEIRDIFNISRAKSKVVVADACHSGSLFTAKTPVGQIMEKYYAAFSASKGGLALLLSSRGNEYSLEDQSLRAGVFSHFLMKGASGLADLNGDGIISIQELHSYLYGNVRMYTANAQTPLLLGNFDPNMPFAVIR